MMQPWQSATVAATCEAQAEAALRVSRQLLDQGAILSARGTICDRLAVDLGALVNTLRALATHIAPSEHPAASDTHLPAVELSGQLWSLSDLLNRCGIAVESSPKRFAFADQVLPIVEDVERNAGPNTGRFDSSSTELRRLWRTVQGYNEALHLHLKFVILLTALAAATFDGDLVSALSQINSEIRAVRFRLQQRNGRPPSREEPQEPCMEQVIENYCASTEVVLICLAREWRVLDDDEKSSISDAEIERDQERRFVSGFAKIANEHFAAGNFSDAERFFTKFLDRAGQHDDWDINEIFQARLKLAACFSAQMRFDSADETLGTIEDGGCTRLQRCQLLQHRAEIALLRSDYARAKEIAQQASVLAQKEKDDTAYHDAISLMIFLCFQMGEVEDAEVYRGMLPRGVGDTRLAGVLNTEQLASILRQMEIDERYDSNDDDESVSAQLWSPSTEKEVVTDPSHDSSDNATSLHISEIPSLSNQIANWNEPRELSTPLQRQHSWSALAETPAVLSGHARDVTAVAFSSDGCRVVSGSDDKYMSIWDIYSGDKLRSALAHGKIRSVACSPHGSKIALTYADRLMICGLKEFAPIDVELSRYPAWDLCFSPNDSDIAVTQGKEIHIVSSNTGKVVKKLLAVRGATDEHPFNGVHWSGPEMRVVASSRSGAIHIWDSTSAIRTLLLDADIGITKGYAIALAVSCDGDWIAATRRSAKKGIRIFRADSSTVHCELADGQENVASYSALAFAANGKCLLTCSAGSAGCIQTWDVERRTCLQTIAVKQSTLHSLVVSPDGTRAACAAGKSILLFAAEHEATDEEAASGHLKDPVSPVASSPRRGSSHRSMKSAGSKLQLWSKRRGSK